MAHKDINPTYHQCHHHSTLYEKKNLAWETFNSQRESNPIEVVSKSYMNSYAIFFKLILKLFSWQKIYLRVVFIHRVDSQSQYRISRQAFEASRSLYEYGDTSSWYSTLVSWLLANGPNIINVPPLRYNHETDKTLISHEDRNRVIHQEI